MMNNTERARRAEAALYYYRKNRGLCSSITFEHLAEFLMVDLMHMADALHTSINPLRAKLTYLSERKDGQDSDPKLNHAWGTRNDGGKP
jgi:hypothetical protein